MKRSENRVIYSKFNISAMSEEVVLYDFENKSKADKLIMILRKHIRP